MLDGLLTYVIAIVSFFTIPKCPKRPKWFSGSELAILHDRRDSGALELEGFRWDGVRQVVTD